MKLAKGFKGRGGKIFSAAIQRLEKSYQHAYVGRKLKKRRFKSTWIMRLNASLRMYGIRYGVFIEKWRKSDVIVNRKVMSELAEKEPFSFKSVVDVILKTSS
ncbi:hypothetical protein TrST_g6372 [Triparma strigata]|uniref:50S ribosomal protein L20 n=1 Tax=Triparma strigata TaxID=1606541 RepID=A0A9W7AWH2_9STRA|nr:hypothetical protein TrST_g6372 [Triparma strigata]